MKGANEYCKVFLKAEQIGRLYILPSSHARGCTFRIFVLPENETVIENAGINPPLNKDSIEVYGAVSGQLGWTEEYGWKHKGKWVEDFNAEYKKRVKDMSDRELDRVFSEKEESAKEIARIEDILSSY